MAAVTKRSKVAVEMNSAQLLRAEIEIAKPKDGSDIESFEQGLAEIQRLRRLLGESIINQETIISAPTPVTKSSEAVTNVVQDKREGERLTKYDVSVDFPSRSIGSDGEKTARWYQEVFEKVIATEPMRCNPRETKLLMLSATEYIAMRKASEITCEEYTTFLVRRARHHRSMNQWTYRAYALFDLAIDKAKQLDLLAKRTGLDAIAPLYGLPIPMKGTGAVRDYPSGAGVGILSGYRPVKDCEIVNMIRAANGIVFGTTNVPAFASSVNTINAASGQTRNPYDHALTPGGSSGGAGSAVAMHMACVAVTEDTGGSTRIPALCNGLFGFDPARNHYPNEGNPGMTHTHDQVGVVARQMEDILLYDRCIMGDRHSADKLHAKEMANLEAGEAKERRTNETNAKSGQKKHIRIGTPVTPFVVGKKFRVDDAMGQKYEQVKDALKRGGFVVVDEDWELTDSEVGEMFGMSISDFKTFGGQSSKWIFEYLDARVSLKDVIEDVAKVGVSHNPMGVHSLSINETNYRRSLGPQISRNVARYNSYFDKHNVDAILVPAAYSVPPKLSETANGTVPLIGADGSKEHGNAWNVFHPHNVALKNLHIPKLSVPTGLSKDGRPTGVQLWGRALNYSDMFKDECSTIHSVRFLYFAADLVRAIHSDKALCRVGPPLQSG